MTPQQDSMQEQIMPLTIRLPAATHEMLRTAAFVTRRSMNEIVIDALEAHKPAMQKSVEEHRSAVNG